MTCLVCQHDESDIAMPVAEAMYRTGEEFEYKRCTACHSWTRTLDDSPRGADYADSYYSFTVDPAENFAGPVARAAATVLARSAVRGRGRIARMGARWAPVREVRSLATLLSSVASARAKGRETRRILDVGSGSGVVPFVLSMSPNVVATGIDPFAPLEFRTNRFELRRCELVEIGGTWDVIMFHHSLEHVRNPGELLSTARRMLSTDGRIVVRVPTVSSQAFESFGDAWFQMDAPRHEFLPSRDGLRRMVEASELVIQHWYDDSSDVQFWMSEHVRAGLSMMDPGDSFRTFRGPNTSIVERWGMRRRARRLNRRLDGDQTCLILAAR